MLYFDDIWLIYSSKVESDYIRDVCEFALAVGDITLHNLTETEITSLVPAEQTNNSAGSDEWGMEQHVDSYNEGVTTPESVASTSGLKNIFIDFMEESGSYLEEIESLILRLEKDRKNFDIVNDIFRPFHTIKR